MTKTEFVKAYCDLCDEGRRRKFPDMRPSERAMSRVDDQRSGERLWRKNAAELRTKTLAQFREAAESLKAKGAQQ